MRGNRRLTTKRIATHLDYTPHTVYRYYDDTGRALYIGCTSNLAQRETAHRTKPWFSRVARLETKEYPNRFRGRLAESDAIKREHPEFNIQHAAPPETMSVRQAAKLSGLPLSCINAAARSGDLPSHSLGADDYNRRILHTDLVAWLNALPEA